MKINLGEIKKLGAAKYLELLRKIYKDRKKLGLIVFGILALLLIIVQFMPSSITLQGEVVIRQINVAPRIAGRVEDIFVQEGDFVKKGTILAKLYSPDIMARAVQAQAASRVAAAQKDKANKGSRNEEITAAYNLWQKALSAKTLAEKSYGRVKELYEGGVISAQKLDEANAQYEAALGDMNAAKSRYDMALIGARDEDKKAANALSEQARGAVSEIESYVDETSVTAPIDGEISTVVVEQGELAAPGLSVVTMLDLSDVWLAFNVREDLIKDFKLNKIIEVRIPALDNKKHKFKITYISKMGDFAVWSATKTHGEFDLKTFEVRARPVEAMPNLRQGMSALTKAKR